MKFKIVADSSADIPVIKSIPFESVPLKIVTDVKEYVDDAALDVAGMVADLLKYKGKSGTACPGPGEWVASFGDAEYVFCVTITSNLSGSYNSACVAKEQYEAAHPDRKVCIIDSWSAGAEMYMIVEKLEELILAGKSFDEIRDEITDYAS
ncbi:MAG: DegV family protein, partial [Peptococcaceae bacterium]|nr:DegV family protein [Peptococcaceae bacterium]